jgi:hypothetical protein
VAVTAVATHDASEIRLDHPDLPALNCRGYRDRGRRYFGGRGQLPILAAQESDDREDQ